MELNRYQKNFNTEKEFQFFLNAEKGWMFKHIVDSIKTSLINSDSKSLILETRIKTIIL